MHTRLSSYDEILHSLKDLRKSKRYNIQPNKRPHLVETQLQLIDNLDDELESVISACQKVIKRLDIQHGIYIGGGFVRDLYYNIAPRNMNVLIHISDIKTVIKELKKMQNRYGITYKFKNKLEDKPFTGDLQFVFTYEI